MHRSAPLASDRPWQFGPWLFGARTDLVTFAGSALAALGLVGAGRLLGFGGGALPTWGFVGLVLGIDVAHVYATLFRTYLDSAELGARPRRYWLTPLAAYACGYALHAQGSLIFWRTLAYLALFHFIRQEVGWLRLYRARAGSAGAAGGAPSRLDARLDEACIYASTLYPVLVWHVAPGTREFSWFVPGDFVTLGAFGARLVPVARFCWLAVLGTWCLRRALGAYRTRMLPLGSTLIVLKTALVWYVGIVLTNSDFDFTVTNVVAHGVPYFVLLFRYGSERRRESPANLGSRVLEGGVVAFAAGLLALAALEELVWDRYVWHDHADLFGSGTDLRVSALNLLVPLLAVPQVTHYLFDGWLWRRDETRRLPAQARALGLASVEARPSG